MGKEEKKKRSNSFSRSRSNSNDKDQSKYKKNGQQNKSNKNTLYKNKQNGQNNKSKEDQGEKCSKTNSRNSQQLPDSFSVTLRDKNDQLDKNFLKNLTYTEEGLNESDHPAFNKELGDFTELYKQKDRIDDVIQQWDSIKYMLNDYELVDIYREGKIQKQRYSATVINYDSNRYFKQPIFSRAYFKLWEILCEYKILDEYFGKSLTIATLAEGPGGFIHCLMDYRQMVQDQEQENFLIKSKYNQYWMKDSYYAITLKVDPNDRRSMDWDSYKPKRHFSRIKHFGYKVNLSYGKKEGNLYYRENLEYFTNQDLNGKKCQLVTSDGGIEVNGRNYNFQELANAKLFFAETILALKIQELGGKFILKIYDSIYNITAQILQVLCLYYNEVRIVKPLLSRPASSERYVICEDFNGITQEQLEVLHDILEEWKNTETNIQDYLGNEKKAKNILKIAQTEQNNKWLSEKFVVKLRESNNECLDKQIIKLKKGFQLIEDQKENPEKFEKNRQARKEEQRVIAKNWCSKYQIPYYR